MNDNRLTDEQTIDMQILLVSKRNGELHKTCLPRGAGIVAALMLFLVLPMTLGVTIYHFTAGHGDDMASAVPSTELARAKARLAEYQQQIEDLKRRSDANIDVLSIKLGRMQAQLMRSNALSQRLAEMAGLDTSEFDFSKEPALGGVASPLETQQLEYDNVMQSLDQLSLRLEQEHMELVLMESILADKDLQQSLDPKGWPVKGSYISSSYGMRNDPFTGHKAFHKGVDIPGKPGAPIHAIAAGVVIHAGKRSGYGRMVEIDHGNGYTTRYAHVAKALVEVGDRVDRGMVIAEVGSTGRSTGPHLHLELLKNGKQVNPRKRLYSAKK